MGGYGTFGWRVVVHQALFGAPVSGMLFIGVECRYTHMILKNPDIATIRGMVPTLRRTIAATISPMFEGSFPRAMTIGPPASRTVQKEAC